MKEGKERAFHSTTPPLAFSRTARLSSDLDIGIALNTPLTSAGQNDTASNVGEPSTAINGQVVVYTGNWYAATSADGAKTFRFIDPAAAFRQFDPPGSSFCCDQVANYIPLIDTFVWLLQYGPDTGNNIQRIAFASRTRWRAASGGCLTLQPTPLARRARLWTFRIWRRARTTCT